jgi:hypothetical protein
VCACMKRAQPAAAWHAACPSCNYDLPPTVLCRCPPPLQPPSTLASGHCLPRFSTVRVCSPLI